MSLPPVLAGPRRRLMAALVLNGSSQAAIALSVGLLTHRLFVDLANPAPTTGVGSLAVAVLALVVLALAQLLLRGIERRDAERLGHDYIGELRQRLFRRLLSLSPRSAATRSRGGITLRLVGDLRALRMWISLGLARGVVCSLSTCGAVAALWLIDPWLSVTAACVSGLGIPLAAGLGRRVQPRVREARSLSGRLAASLTERVGALGLIQSNGQARRELRRLGRLHRRSADAAAAQALPLALLRASGDTIAALTGVAVLAVGAWRATQGHGDAGVVASSLVLVGLMLPGLRELGLALAHLQGASVARERIAEFAEFGRVIEDAPAGADPGAVDWRRADWTFEAVRLDTALHHVDARIPGDGLTALIGPNGAGKSSVLSLMARLCDPDEGEIRVAGRALASIPLRDLRRRIGLVSTQLSGEGAMLRGSLRYNLCYRAPRADAAAQAAVLVRCGLWERVQSLPRGLDTRVLEGGANFSPGERLRWSLARALLGRPAVLLVDETDAGLDHEACAVLDHVLDGFGGTVLIATQRWARVAGAKHVLALRDGRVAFEGRPSDFLSVDTRARSASRSG